MLPTLLIQLKLVFGTFWQSNINSTLDFCPRAAKKGMNTVFLIASSNARYQLGNQFFCQKVTVHKDQKSLA